MFINDFHMTVVDLKSLKMSVQTRPFTLYIDKHCRIDSSNIANEKPISDNNMRKWPSVTVLEQTEPLFEKLLHKKC